MNMLSLAIAAGLSLGIIVGYRVSKAVFLRVGGPFARKPVIVGFALAGSCAFLAPASIFAVLGVRDLDGPVGSAVSSGSSTALLGVAIGIATIIASGLVVAVFASVLCGRFIEEVRSRR